MRRDIARLARVPLANESENSVRGFVGLFPPYKDIEEYGEELKMTWILLWKYLVLKKRNEKWWTVYTIPHMSINFSIRIGPHCDRTCISVKSLSGHCLPWKTEMRYLGVYIVQSRNMKCSLDACKRSLYRAANSIFGKSGRIASEEVVLHLISTKCIPILLYGLESFSLYQYQLKIFYGLL